MRPRIKDILPSATVEAVTEADSAATDAATRCRVKGRRRHLGELARQLREAAGLTRKQLAADVGVSDMTLINFEFSRRLPTPDTLNRILAHPAMTRLVELALVEGVAMPAPDAPDGDARVYLLIQRREKLTN